MQWVLGSWEFWFKLRLDMIPVLVKRIKELQEDVSRLQTDLELVSRTNQQILVTVARLKTLIKRSNQRTTELRRDIIGPLAWKIAKIEWVIEEFHTRFELVLTCLDFTVPPRGWAHAFQFPVESFVPVFAADSDTESDDERVE